MSIIILKMFFSLHCIYPLIERKAAPANKKSCERRLEVNKTGQRISTEDALKLR
jgi:hypothetical protein